VVAEVAVEAVVAAEARTAAAGAAAVTAAVAAEAHTAAGALPLTPGTNLFLQTQRPVRIFQADRLFFTVTYK